MYKRQTWDDANGVRHYKTEIKINDMKLLDDKGKKGVGLDEAKLAGEEEGEVPTETQASEPEALEVIAEEEVKKPKEDLEKADDGEDLF